MSRKLLAFVAPMALAVGLAACDGTEEYEARIADLEGQLEAARGEVETFRGEAEELRGQLEELEAAGPAEGAPDINVDAIQSQFQEALAALQSVDDRLQNLAAPEATEVRQDLQQVAEAIGNVAQDMGLELQAIAPEAGAETQAVPAAGGTAAPETPEVQVAPEVEGEEAEEAAPQQQ